MSIELTELSINGLFAIRNQAEVLNFLEQNPEMVPALRESYDKIKKYFPDSKLTLDLLVDPEWPYKSRLIIWINTTMDAYQELETLNKMDKEWTVNLADDVASNLIINLGL